MPPPPPPYTESIRTPGGHVQDSRGRSDSEDSDIDIHGIDQHQDEDDSHEEDEKHAVNNTTTNNNGGGVGALSLVKTLSRVLSRPESNFDPGPPPDGGARAWCTGMFLFLFLFLFNFFFFFFFF